MDQTLCFVDEWLMFATIVQLIKHKLCCRSIPIVPGNGYPIDVLTAVQSGNFNRVLNFMRSSRRVLGEGERARGREGQRVMDRGLAGLRFWLYEVVRYRCCNDWLLGPSCHWF